MFGFTQDLPTLPAGVPVDNATDAFICYSHADLSRLLEHVAGSL